MTQEDYIVIENYFRGKLSKKEQELLLERLKTEPEFKAAYDLEAQCFKSLDEKEWSFMEQKTSEVEAYQELLNDQDMKKLKSTLSNVNAEHNRKTPSKVRSVFYYLAAASLVAFLAMQFFFNQSVSNQELYSTYADLNNLPSFATRGEAHKLNNQLIKAEKFFDAKHYEEALALFQPILETHKSDESVYVYTGIAQLELGNFKSAAQTFDNLINSDLSNAYVGYWYKALMYLKQDKVEEAQSTLRHIVEASLYNHEKAEALLSELNNE